MFLDAPETPIRRILIANRGEIALRIIRACADEGIAAIAVYADADRDAPFVRTADEAHALDGQRPADTYLNADKILAIAARAGADAVHPGYGFLSENADFARAVQAAGLIWIGPEPEVIDALGDKIRAREIARAVGAPLVAGSPGPVASGAEALDFARQHGLPIAIKAAFGGGGRGIRVARSLDEVEALFEAASREATAAFGRGDCYVEQFLDRPRHIEAQVLADRHGTVRVLGTRDCSLQRRSQKLVEEAPAPFLTDAQRTQIHDAARAICAHAGYSSAGTVEFLMSETGTISFLEVNTRLQVEHPVTEETTGIDIVRAMIRIAGGALLADGPVPEPQGHAIEFRINAEDVGRGFLPTPGPITRWSAPGGIGIRIDSGVEAGAQVPAAFDSLMAKLIVSGPDRATAIARARRALREFRIDGVASVLPFHRAVLEAPEFTTKLAVYTRWIETDFAGRLAAAITPAARVVPPEDAPMLRLAIEIDGKRHDLALPQSLLPAAALGEPSQPATTGQPNDITAPVAGILSLWKIADGAEVEAGQQIAVIEAMKMETPVEAPRAGRLTHLAAEGETLAQDGAFARVEPVNLPR
ncbi:acetyl/propionyl/methylcrotonyl-CoA carboxylase subunit alpha [Paracoccus tibetensis]|uniref:biotin carboxylase n=1 Tax=Paracoccus tibetensis TaxID=336292 RepID=A0A1G5JJR6_9RHOB|nr:biotin carboxylase N-terminal domain-containing protein [Paracoccus tibetensis]SCY88141.1 acetyl-CoA/propionyl-CoA carboxylase, biotin carboxylase, biotin carboxyl carrier protein [Paracoccus tibetensis]